MKASKILLNVTGILLVALTTFGTVGASQSANAAPYQQDGGTESFGSVTTDEPTQIQIDMNTEQPVMTPKQKALAEDALSQTKLRGPETPSGLNASIRNAPPEVPQTANGNAGQRAADTMTIFQNSSLASGPSKSQTNEPSVADTNGANIFATYNWYAALSTNYGSSWTFINPATAFPAANGGFCCDQDVFYDPSRDLTFWLIQYVNDANGNMLRLAVSKGQANLASGTWYYYDFIPESYGGTNNSDWFDFPHLTRTDNYLYLSSNIFTTGNSFLATTMIRLPLDQLSAGSALSTDYYASGAFNFTAAHGGTDTLYFARHLSTTQLRVYTWLESDNSGSVTSTDVTHTAYLNSGYNCTVTASGKNPCGNDDDRLVAGWLRRSNNELGFMWDAAQGTDGLGTFAYPYARTLTMNATTKVVVSDYPIWNADFAWLLPSAAGNARGHVGGTIAFAGGTTQPSCNAWLYDDFTPGGSFSISSNMSVSIGDTSPTANRWGDYLRTRQSGFNPFHFIGTCYAIEGGVTTPRIARFGRERDNGGGSDTVGVFRPSNGALYLKNTNTSGFADYVLTYGLPGDYPIVGDWDGNGTDTIGVYRDGNFYLRNSNTNGFADIVVSFGAAGDQPVAGDWDGDGVDTIGLYRSSIGTFFLRNSNSTGDPDISFSLGIAGDVGIAGDWNGDGTDTTGVFRPSNGALYLKNANTTGFADMVLTYGLPGDKPVTGDWNNNGVGTIGIYRTGGFYLRNSNTNGFADINLALGISGDIPIAGNWNGLP